MPTRYRKSVNLGSGLKLNIGKKGITSVSIGSGPLRHTFGTSGRRTTTARIPGTGLSYSTTSSSKSRARSAPPPIPQPPKPGLFSPPIEKRFYEAVDAYRRGNWTGARTAFQACSQLDRNAPSPYLFGAIIAIVQGDDRTAVEWLEWVVQNAALPDALMAKYAGGLTIPVSITERIKVQAPLESAGPPLLLAEIYQATDRLDDAIGLMQQMHDANPNDAAITLSLADLLFEDGDDEAVIELGAGVSNDSDVTLGLLHLKAKALLRSGMGSAGIADLTACLKKTSGRDPDLLREIRYDRAAAYQELGQAAKARQDWEKIYGELPSYRDVKQRLAAS